MDRPWGIAPGGRDSTSSRLLRIWKSGLTRAIAAWRKAPWYLGVVLGMMLFFTPHQEWHQDLYLFRNVAERLQHPYWTRWLFALLRLPPEPVAFVALSTVCTALFYVATHVFKGQPWKLFVSFAFAWTLFYGQIDGLVVGGIALAWWALQRERPILIGAGLALASIKPQMSLPLALMMWWWSPSRLKTLLIPALMGGASLLQWGWWLPEWLWILLNTEDIIYLSRNISLWPILGPWVLLTWLPVARIRLTRHRKMIAVAANTALTMPYFPLPSAVLLLSMPIPWWFWALSQLPWLGSVIGYWVYYPMKMLPPLLLLWALWPALRPFWNKALSRWATGVALVRVPRRG